MPASMDSTMHLQLFTATLWYQKNHKNHYLCDRRGTHAIFRLSFNPPLLNEPRQTQMAADAIQHLLVSTLDINVHWSD